MLSKFMTLPLLATLSSLALLNTSGELGSAGCAAVPVGGPQVLNEDCDDQFVTMTLEAKNDLKAKLIREQGQQASILLYLDQKAGKLYSEELLERFFDYNHFAQVTEGAYVYYSDLSNQTNSYIVVSSLSFGKKSAVMFAQTNDQMSHLEVDHIFEALRFLNCVLPGEKKTRVFDQSTYEHIGQFMINEKNLWDQ